MAEELIKISDLDSGTPLNTDYIPYVDGITDTTKKSLKSELKGDKGDAATVDAGTTTTLAAGQSATVTNVGNTAAAIFNFAIPQGIQGITGADGACVESVAFVGNDMVFTLDDASTVTLTNAKVTLKGDKGDTGAKITSAEFVGNDLVFTLDDSSTVTITGAKTALKGDKGDTGLTGVDWQGAWSAGTYTATQSVSHNGSSWIATTTTTEEPSISATDWDLIALKGTDGAGSGDVSGPASATNSNVAVFDGVTGKLIKDGGATLASKQDALGFTPENSANKETSALDTSTTKYPCNNVVKSAVDGKIASLVEDTTPQLGGQLDVNGQALGDGTLEILKFEETASAVNEITVKNAATGNAPELQATGDDTNIDLNLVPKGTGGVKVGGVEIPSISSTSTLTNKRITKRVASTTDDATAVIDCDSYDEYYLTAIANATEISITGTPTAGQTIFIGLKDAGVTKALTWTGITALGTVVLPTDTNAGKQHIIGLKYIASAWRAIAADVEA